MAKKELTRKNCFANATKNLVNANGRVKPTKKSARTVFKLDICYFSIDQWENDAKYKIIKRQNIKNGNAKVMLLKSQLTMLRSQMKMTTSQLEAIPVVMALVKSFLKIMVFQRFLSFTEVVVMALDFLWTQVWMIWWMLLVVMSNFTLHLLHKMDFGWEIHQDRVWDAICLTV